MKRKTITTIIKIISDKVIFLLCFQLRSFPLFILAILSKISKKSQELLLLQLVLVSKVAVKAMSQ